MPELNEFKNYFIGALQVKTFSSIDFGTFLKLNLRKSFLALGAI